MINPSEFDSMDMSQPANSGIIETIRSSVGPDSVAHTFGVDKNVLIDVGVYGGIGFIAGFLLKKYSEYFISLIVLLVGIVVLQQFDYVSFSLNSVKIHQALGFENMPMSGDAYGNFMWEWARTHPISSSSLVVGFFIGIKVG